MRQDRRNYFNPTFNPPFNSKWRRVLRFRNVTLVFATILLMVLFQNCNPNLKCENNNCVTTSPSVPSPSETKSELIESSPQLSLGNSAGSGSSSSRVLGGGSSGGNSKNILGGGSTESSSGASLSLGGSPSGRVGSGNSSATCDGNTFKILEGPFSQEVKPKTYLQLGVRVCGGAEPLQFKWYKDDKQLNPSNYGPGQLCNTNSICGLNMDRVLMEGRYHVVVTDAKGNSLTSSKAQISLIDLKEGCEGGQYVAHGGSSPYVDTKFFDDLFLNTRGNFIVISKHPAISSMMFNPGLFGFVVLNNMPSSTYGKRISFPNFCQSYIPRIQTVLFQNQVGRFGFFGMYGYNLVGSVTMECQNNSWKLISNTCEYQENSGE